MTIYTGKLIDKDDSDIVKPQVVTEPLHLPEHENLTNEEMSGPPIVVTVLSRKKRGACANYCLILTALVVLATGILGGIYLYKSLSHRRFSGYCEIPYFEEEELASMRQRAQSVYTQSGQYRRRYGQFQEHIEIDEVDGRYEYIDVPEFEESASSMVVHDFQKNLTAIVSSMAEKCYLMPMNRSVTASPRDALDLMSKLLTGYYMPDLQIVRERYRVVRPQIRDVSQAGFYIWKPCHRFETYMLEKIGPHDPVAMVKRSVPDTDADNRVHYAIPGGFKLLPVITIEGM